MGKPFKFTKQVRDDLRATLARRRFAAEAIERFIDAAEYAIVKWERTWLPVDAQQMAELRRAHGNITKHLAAIQYEWAKLPDWFTVPLWREFVSNGEIASLEEARRLNGEAREFFHALWLGFWNEQQEAGQHKSRRDMRKHALVRPIVEDFANCFGRDPSSTPAGPFMDVVDLLGQAIGERIGKDVVQQALADFKAHRARIEAFQRGDYD